MTTAKIESALTVKDSIESGVQLNKLVKANWNGAMKMIVRLLKNTAAFFNVNGQITEQQLVMTAQTIIDVYGYDNIEDLIIALKNGRAGMYGKLYGRFDGEIVLDWMKQYMDSKAEALEKKHHQQKVGKVEINSLIVDFIKNEMTEKGKANMIENVDISDLSEKDVYSTFVAVKDDLNYDQLRSYKKIFKSSNDDYSDTIEWIENRLYQLRIEEVKEAL